jgi:hypothetical protein
MQNAKTPLKKVGSAWAEISFLASLRCDGNLQLATDQPVNSLHIL